MLHNENLRRADESYEIRHDNSGNAVHVFIKDGTAIVYPSLWDFIKCYAHGVEVERFYIDEDLLERLYESDKYDYHSLKATAKTLV